MKQDRNEQIAIGHLKKGKHNSITDVSGVLVGHKTVIRGEGKPGLIYGVARTGVSVVYPHKDVWTEPVYAGTSVFNGNGEMTGCAWVEESGLLTTPIGLTNTHSVGVVRDSLIEYYKKKDPSTTWMLPVVAETWDGYLSDINGMHVKKEDVFEALENAANGKIAEGNVGGGTGMTCFEFKGGIGNSSRHISIENNQYTVGVLVQANFGARHQFMLNGIPVGKEIPTDEVPGRVDKKKPSLESSRDDTGSIIVIIATDVPILPDQCKRLAKRASLGLGLVGSVGSNNSGDIFLAFSTGNICKNFLSSEGDEFHNVKTVGPETMNDLFEGVVEATQEAIINALFAGETMKGIDGRVIYALPQDRLFEVISKYKK